MYLAHGKWMYDASDAFSCVILGGNIEVMEWCLQNGGVFNRRYFWYAARSGKIEALECLKLHNCP